MDFFANPICCLYLTGHMIRISSFPGPVLNSFPGGALLEVRWSKTIQFRDRVVHIPLPYIPSSVLCPIASVLRAMAFTKSADAQSHAFCYFDTKHLRPKCLTYRLFLVRLRECLSMLGYSPSSYAGHSFRRGGGGAPLPLNLGFPLNLSRC